jgi:hypothetical protein
LSADLLVATLLTGGTDEVLGAALLSAFFGTF